MRSLARIGLDRLLQFCPHYDVVRVEWQDPGPWVLVTLGQASDTNGDVFARHEYAIWKNTGAVYGMNEHGAVNDEPLLSL